MIIPRNAIAADPCPEFSSFDLRRLSPTVCLCVKNGLKKSNKNSNWIAYDGHFMDNQIDTTGYITNNMTLWVYVLKWKINPP